MSRRLYAIQRYISAFEYNFTGRTFVSLRRDKGMRHLVYTAKVLMRECLPIQCVEALFIGVHLTNGFTDVSRFHKISTGDGTITTKYKHKIETFHCQALMHMK